MKPLSFETLSAWEYKATTDALHWAKTIPISEARRKDFETGFVAGWRDAIATLKLHGYFKETYASSPQKGRQNAKRKS